MKIADYIVLAVITVIVTAIVYFIVRQKKKGVKCIGCPHSKSCSSCNCNSHCK